METLNVDSKQMFSVKREEFWKDSTRVVGQCSCGCTDFLRKGSVYKCVNCSRIFACDK